MRRQRHEADEPSAILEGVGRRSIQRVGIVRYNPFEDTGGNQSFALALTDAKGDGFVISSLHTRTGTRVAGPVPLPTTINKYTVVRSPFIDKDSREQFEMRTHKRILDILDANPKVVDALMRLNLPSGVNIEIKL